MSAVCTWSAPTSTGDHSDALRQPSWSTGERCIHPASIRGHVIVWGLRLVDVLWTDPSSTDDLTASSSMTDGMFCCRTRSGPRCCLLEPTCRCRTSCVRPKEMRVGGVSPLLPREQQGWLLSFCVSDVNLYFYRFVFCTRGSCYSVEFGASTDVWGKWRKNGRSVLIYHWDCVCKSAVCFWSTATSASTAEALAPPTGRRRSLTFNILVGFAFC